MKRREVIKTFIMILRFQIEEQFSNIKHTIDIMIDLQGFYPANTLCLYNVDPLSTMLAQHYDAGPALKKHCCMIYAVFWKH